jgi:hypothetical protein
MTQPREEITRLVSDLEEQRDALRVKLHLLKADARDQWTELEKKLAHLRARAAVVGREAEDAAGGVKDALGLVADEIKKGYARIRRLI